MMQTEATVKTTSDSAPITWGTRISYGLGDTACNIVMGITTAVLTLFYTDYAGVNVAIVGLVMLISRIFDGTSDVIMGVVTEKQNPNGENAAHGCCGWQSRMQ